MSTPNSAAGQPGAAAGADAAAAGTPAAGAAGSTPDAAAAAAAALAAGTQGAAPAAGDGTGKTGDAAAAAPKPPDKYELALPDGGPLDAADLDAFTAVAKEKGWTNEQAQAALTEHAEALVAQAHRFLTETQAHTEIGGDKLAVAQQHARAVLDKFLPADSPEGQVLRSGLDKTGYGNWTPLVLLLARIGKAMAEDSPIADGARASGAKAPRDAAAVLYGSS